MNALRGTSGSANPQVEHSGVFAGRAPIFGGPELREGSRGLLGDLLTAPSGPGTLPGDPTSTTGPTTTTPPVYLNLCRSSNRLGMGFYEDG